MKNVFMPVVVVLAMFCEGFIVILVWENRGSVNIFTPIVNRGIHYSRPTPKLYLAEPNAGFVSALNKTWMTWKSTDTSWVYRACVPRDQQCSEGGLISVHEDMTITKCLVTCSNKGFTYAALEKGTRCFCCNSSSNLLNYVKSTYCNIPCGGERQFNCGGEEYFSLYRTNVTDARCNIKQFKSLPLTALASFPRSGNTWARQLIESASGYYTGTIYWRSESHGDFYRRAFLGGNEDYKLMKTICVKTHRVSLKDIQEFKGGAVLLIRNPYQTIVGEVFRQQMRKTAPEKIVNYFKTKEWIIFADKLAASWNRTVMQWLTHSPRIIVIHYEDMQARTYQELSRIIHFLNIDIDPVRIKCAIEEYPSSLSTGISLGIYGARQTRAYLTNDPFSASLRKRIDGYIRAVNKSLAKHHQKTFPTDMTVDIF